MTKKMKNIIFIILIFLGLLSMINTNNNPNPFIQRIFRPIHIGSTTTYYATLVPILLIYFSLLYIYVNNNFSILSTTFRRILILILISTVFYSASQGSVKLYKSLTNDLNSIYCYRDNMDLLVQTVENKQQVLCTLELTNFSYSKKEFHVKVKLEGSMKDDLKADFLTNDDELLILNGRERRKFQINIKENNVNGKENGFNITGYIKDFEFSLYNDKQEVRFVKKE